MVHRWSIVGMALSLAGLLAGLLWGCECSEDAPASAPDDEETSETSLTEPTEDRPDDGEGVVTLRYGWPDGARGRVSGERSVARSAGPDLRASLGYRLEVERAGDETVLHSGQLEIAPITAQQAAEVTNAAGVIDTYLPSIVVLPDRVARLADFDAARHEIAAAFEPAVSADVRGGRTWHLLEPLWTDRSALLRATASKWDWLVAGYVDREMQLGETGELSGTSRTALTAEAVQTSGEITAVGRVPCFAGDEPERCVFISSQSRFSDEAAAQMAEGLEVEDLTVRMRSTLVTEVDSLLPHYARLRMVRTFTVGEGEAAQSITENDVKTFRFQWERGSIR